jgi:hypothetical protein
LATSKLFPFDQEQKRLLRMLKTHGLESIEDLMLVLSGAVLDLVQKQPEKKKLLIKMSNQIGKARSNCRRVRICS